MFNFPIWVVVFTETSFSGFKSRQTNASECFLGERTAQDFFHTWRSKRSSRHDIFIWTDWPSFKWKRIGETGRLRDERKADLDRSTHSERRDIRGSDVSEGQIHTISDNCVLIDMVGLSLATASKLGHQALLSFYYLLLCAARDDVFNVYVCIVWVWKVTAIQQSPGLINVCVSFCIAYRYDVSGWETPPELRT